MAFMPLPSFMGKQQTPGGRLILLVLLLAAAAAGAQQLLNYTRGGVPVPAMETQRYAVADMVPGQTDPLANVEAINFIPKGIISVDVDTDSSEESLARSNDIARNNEAIYYALAYLKGAGPERIRADSRMAKRYSSDMFLERPDELRGNLLPFYGITRTVMPVEFPEAPAGIRWLWLIVAEDIRRTSFYAVLTPRRSELVVPNEVIAFDGIFVQRYATKLQLAPDKPPFWMWMPLFVADRAYADRRPLPPPDLLADPDDAPFSFAADKLVATPDRTILDSIWQTAKDGSDVRNLPVMVDGRFTKDTADFHREAANILGEKVAIDHLFRHVAALGPETLERQSDPTLTFDRLMTGMRAPAEALFRITSVTGHALAVRRIRPAGLESGLKQFYLLTMTDTRYTNFDYRWTVACINLPQSLRVGDKITVRGMFAKLHPYQDRVGQWYWSPLLVVNQVEPVVPWRAPMWVYGAIAGGIVLLATWWTRLVRREQEAATAMVDDARRRTRTADPAKAAQAVAEAREKLNARREAARRKDTPGTPPGPTP
mgnify:CR=1 FL=1